MTHTAARSSAANSLAADHRQKSREARPSGARDFHRALPPFDNGGDEIEPKPQRRLSPRARDERLEEPWRIAFGKTAAAIRDVQRQITPFRQPAAPVDMILLCCDLRRRCFIERNANLAGRIADGVDSIAQQNEKHR